MKIKQNRAGQRGVALLLTLGVLALLMVLAMSFAYQARTQRMVASVNADTQRARLLCESTFERALGYIKNTYTGATAADMYPGTKSSSLFFAGSGGTWIGRRYAVSMNAAGSEDTSGFDAAVGTNVGFQYIPSTPSIHANRSWHHIMANEPFTDDDGDGTPEATDGNGIWDAGEPFEDKNGDGTRNQYLTARLLFLVIDQSGMLDPGGTVTHEEPWIDLNADTVADAAEYWDYDNGGTHTTTGVVESSVQRLGAFPDEITLAYDQFRLFVPVNTGVTPNKKTRWFSWQHLWEGLYVPLSVAEAVAQTHAQKYFPYSYDIEAFRDSGSDYHRFNLFRTDWDTLTVGSITGGSATAFDVTTTAGDGIPWLSATSPIEDSTGNDVTAQVTANLVDYCDSDSLPETNVTTVDPWPASAYCGLEEVPYISEIAITGMVTQLGGGGPTPNKIKELTVQIDVELVNIYGQALSIGDAVLDVYVDYDGLDLGPTTLNGETYTITIPSGTTIGAHSYKADGDTRVSNAYNVSNKPNLKFEAVEVRAVLSDSSGNVLDVASMGASPGFQPLSSGNLAAYGSVQAMDPRANTSPSGWAWSGNSFENVNCDTLSSVNTADAACDPSSVAGSGNGDDETVTDPAAGVSTAFIRNAPMKSPWELGAIHRGEPWCTLNLTLYNDGSATKNYAGGDALILDQVKIGSPTERQGKVNINTAGTETLDALFTGLTVGGTYASPSGGTALTTGSGNQVESLRTAVLAGNGATGGSPFVSRSEIVDIAALVDGSVVTQNTNRKQEELIGKIANLTTVRQNIFEIVAVAQAVRDTGSINAPDSVEYATGSYCTVMAEQKVMGTVYRDAFNNTYRIVRYEYLED